MTLGNWLLSYDTWPICREGGVSWTRPSVRCVWSHTCFRPSHPCHTRPSKSRCCATHLIWHFDPSAGSALYTFVRLPDTSTWHVDFRRWQSNFHRHWTTPQLLWRWLCSMRSSNLTSSRRRWQCCRVWSLPIQDTCQSAKKPAGRKQKELKSCWPTWRVVRGQRKLTTQLTAYLCPLNSAITEPAQLLSFPGDKSSSQTFIVGLMPHSPVARYRPHCE